MAKKRSTRSRAIRASPKPVSIPVVEHRVESAPSGLKDEHRTFSHVMYVLFLVAITIAAYFTFQSFMILSTNQNFFGILGLLMVAWSWLFWEFAHRVHHKY